MISQKLASLEARLDKINKKSGFFESFDFSIWMDLKSFLQKNNIVRKFNYKIYVEPDAYSITVENSINGKALAFWFSNRSINVPGKDRLEYETVCEWKVLTGGGSSILKGKEKLRARSENLVEEVKEVILEILEDCQSKGYLD